MVVVALSSVDLVESVDLVFVDLVVNCTLFVFKRRNKGLVNFCGRILEIGGYGPHSKE